MEKNILSVFVVDLILCELCIIFNSSSVHDCRSNMVLLCLLGKILNMIDFFIMKQILYSLLKSKYKTIGCFVIALSNMTMIEFFIMWLFHDLGLNRTSYPSFFECS